MPRKTVEQRSGRVQVASSDTVSTFDVVAPTAVAADSSLARKANALSEALGLGADLGVVLTEKFQQKSFEEGARDQSLGQVDQERLDKNRGYRKAVTQLRAKANFEQDKAEFDDFVKTQDIETPEELDKLMNEFFQSKYEGLDDPWTAEIITPRLLAFKEDKQNKLVESQNEKVVNQIAGDLQISTRAAYARGELNIQELNDEIKDTLGASSVNEVMFTILSDIAIDNGDPSVFDLVPDKFGPAHSFKSDPNFNEKLNNAILRANNTKIAKEKAASDAIKDAQEKAQEVVEKQIADAILDGKDPGELIDTYLEINGDPSKALTYRTKFNTIRDDLEEHAGKPTAVVGLEAALFTGDADIQDLVEAYAEGTLGSGLQAKKEFSRLLGSWDDAKRSLREPRDPMMRPYLDDIKGNFNPGSGQFVDAAAQAVQRDALLKYHQLVNEQNVSPSEAHGQVMSQFSPIWESVASNNVTSTREIDAFIRFAKGTGSYQELVSSGITNQDIRTLRDDAEKLGLSPDEVRNALLEIADRVEGQ